MLEDTFKVDFINKDKKVFEKGKLLEDSIILNIILLKYSIENPSRRDGYSQTQIRNGHQHRHLSHVGG